MTDLPPFQDSYIHLNEAEATRLQKPATTGFAVEVHPPRDTELPETVPKFIRGIQEYQTRWLGLRNASPITAYEIRRVNGELTLQYVAPTQRLERKIRLHLTNQIPDVSFTPGVNGLPVTTDTTIGGAILTTGRRDWYPIQTEFDDSPSNALTSSLHRHAMQDTDVIIQVLFQPVIGQPLRRRWWRRRAYQRIGYLRKQKAKLWGNRAPTPREKHQANAIEDKAGTNRFWTTIRIIALGPEEYTESRIKELSSGFNVYENPDTSQYFNTVTVESVRRKPVLRFCKAVADRRFRSWSRRFQTSVPELAALVALPSTKNANIHHAQP